MKKIIILLFLILLIVSSNIFAVVFILASDKMEVIIQNVDTSVTKIELLRIENCEPSEIFKYEIQKSYKSYFIENQTIYIFDDENPLNSNYDKIQINRNGEEIKVYKTDYYNKNRYIYIKLSDNNLKYPSVFKRIHTIYHNDNHEVFALYKINDTKEIMNYKIKDGTCKFLINDLNHEECDFVIRIYNGEENKDIIIGDNLATSFSEGPLNLIKKTFDYKTGERVNQETDLARTERQKRFAVIGISLIIILLIEILIAKIMKILNYKTVIKVNLVTYILSYFVFLVPLNYNSETLLDILGTISYYFILVLLEILKLFIEIGLYRKLLKEETMKKIIIYSILANLASLSIYIYNYIMYYNNWICCST